MLLPFEVVKRSSARASSGCQIPDALRVPSLAAKDVTIFASAAFAKSMSPFHCVRVNTPEKPGGGVAGGGASESWKYTVLAQEPETRT
jgi:hypothetical protein